MAHKRGGEQAVWQGFALVNRSLKALKKRGEGIIREGLSGQLEIWGRRSWGQKLEKWVSEGGRRRFWGKGWWEGGGRMAAIRFLVLVFPFARGGDPWEEVA